MEVANGMASVDLVLRTVEMVASGDDMRITASTHPVYPTNGAAYHGERTKKKKKKEEDDKEMIGTSCWI